MIMLTRLNQTNAVKQLIFAGAGIVISLFVPVIMQAELSERLGVYYAGIGIVRLILVAVLAESWVGQNWDLPLQDSGSSRQNL